MTVAYSGKSNKDNGFWGVVSTFPTKADLESAAKEIAETAPADFQGSVYLYFICRYLVAVYEVQFGSIPIQVWNEYRNALDHLMRHYTSGAGTESPSGQIGKMEGHIQRAVLDISKLLCHDFRDKLSSTMGAVDCAALKLVDNGRFISQLYLDIASADDVFLYAKTVDIQLGVAAANNARLLSNYLDAVYSHVGLHNKFVEKMPDISAASEQLAAIRAQAAMQHSKHAFKEHVIASIAAKCVWAVLGALVAVLALNPTFDDPRPDGVNTVIPFKVRVQDWFFKVVDKVGIRSNDGGAKAASADNGK